MKNSLKALGVTSILFVVVLIISAFVTSKNFGGGNGFVSSACSVTHSVVVIGHQESRTLLSDNSRRAWATIKQPLNATNTLSLSLGGTAVSGQGYSLPNATTSNYASEMSFGLNTDLPFTGAVTGRTASASSTVLVTDCVYTR